MDVAGDLKLHGALDHHDQLVYVVDIVFPALARRIDPQAARKPSASPSSRDFALIYGFMHRLKL